MPDLTSLASSVTALLKAANQTVAVAESSAGGLISAALVSIPGASAYYIGGGVVYTAAARRALLRVGDEAMAGMRASTEPYALLKARTLREQMGATWGLAETGASGPTGNRYGDAAGHACIAVARSSALSPSKQEAPTVKRICGRSPKRRWIYWKCV
jgi:nicotinamide-nucleotide amidase